MQSSSTPWYSRRARHAGSWYSDEESVLAQTLDSYMESADFKRESIAAEPLRAIVCPHAGYSYSGPTAAYSYKALQQELVIQQQQQQQPETQQKARQRTTTTIVVLHPSHHVYLKGCAISGAYRLETPLGNLRVNDVLRQELLIQFAILNSTSAKATLSVMKQDDDEHEHSGEMQYPFLALILKRLNLLDRMQVLPIMCGALSVLDETTHGTALSPILERPEVITVISSDFCHWGSRFQYNPTSSNSKSMPIHEYIRQLDHRGMDLIAAQTPGAFADYLKETHNTICGRHAIAVWLRAVEASAKQNKKKNDDDKNQTFVYEIAFVAYAQSSAVVSMRESSVSYAAAVAKWKPIAP